MITERDNLEVKSVAIILAAGSSSRMGQSKQLLKIENESLIRKTIRTVIDSAIDETVVVIGSTPKVHRQEISDLPIHIINNKNWANGMGSSLKCGILFVEEQFASCEAILVTVCDQPLLTTDHLKKLIGTFHSENRQIVASFYSGSAGVPVVFSRLLFERLLTMDDRHGAKGIIHDHLPSVSLIDFPDGVVDLDTSSDWEEFLQTQ